MKQILVVEDEYAIVEMIKAVLEAEDYQVLTAGDGKGALEILKELHPDLILCDIMMPRLDGRKFCMILQSTPEYRSIPIVMMSALGEQLIQDTCTYDAFLPKPFDLDHMLDLVSHLLAKDSSK